jgi:murein DD-endopeptidase MepM/ murein hydrolase activator NlpD
MAGLLWPIRDHHTTQRFAGEHPFEPTLFLVRDAIGPRRARSRPFPNGVSYAHVHGAIDISCPIGTKVFAPEAGRVVVADTYKSTGEHYVMLQIKPGTILFFTHLDEFKVRVGRHVERGQVIARSGNTGMSTGPHLHWEVRITTNAGADFQRSWRWFKWNPRRLRVGGDLAGLRAIVPPGVYPEEPLEQPEPADEPPEISPEPITEAAEPIGEAEDPLAGGPEALGDVANPVDTATDPDPDDPPEPGDEAVDSFGDFAATLDGPVSVAQPDGPKGQERLNAPSVGP